MPVRGLVELGGGQAFEVIKSWIELQEYRDRYTFSNSPVSDRLDQNYQPLNIVKCLPT